MINVDQDELIEAIEMVEEKGPLKSLGELYEAVSIVLDGPSSQIIKDKIEEWNIDTKTKPKPKQISGSYIDYTCRPIAIPSGGNPCELKAFDFNSVKNWAVKVMAIGKSQGCLYTEEALAFFLRDLFDHYHCDEYNQLKQTLSEVMSDI